MYMYTSYMTYNYDASFFAAGENQNPDSDCHDLYCACALTEIIYKIPSPGVEPRPPAWRASVLPQSQRGSFDKYGFDFKTTFHKNPQLTTTYRQEAPIAQYVCRIDAQIAVRFCAIC